MKFLDIVRDYTPVHMRAFIYDHMHIIEGISNYMDQEQNDGNRITPSINVILSPYHLVSMDPAGLFPNSLRVVFILQDPYPTPGAACGVATATLNGSIQPTLSNMYKRICDTYTPSVGDMPSLVDGDIRGWCMQGVLMMNASMTTRERDISAPHVDVWSTLTQPMVKWMSETFPFLVFVLFGKKAQYYKRYINQSKHHVIETSHPSTRGSAYGFSTCDVFNTVNTILSLNLREPIKWEQYQYI